MPSRKEAV